MAASFNTQSLMFSMEELVGVVKLIIQMESALAEDDDQKNGAAQQHAPRRPKHRSSKHKKHREKDPNREPPNTQRWISRQNKRDILFLLASISGVKMKIYSLPTNNHTNTHSHKSQPQPQQPSDPAKIAPPPKSRNSKHKAKGSAKGILKERVCRISMDGRYLSMGEDVLSLDKRLEISLGVDVCYVNVRAMLRQLGVYDYYTHVHGGAEESTSSGSSTSSGTSHSPYSTSNSSVSITDEIIRNARFNAKLGMGKLGLGGAEKLKAKHCLTIHDPATARTLIFELANCSDRTMWAKGLCHLKHLNQRARNFRWTVVAYLISKYASTLNAHSQSNLSHSKGLKGVGKGLSALRMGLNLKGSKGSKGGSKARRGGHANPMNTPCYFEPFAQLIRVIGAQGNNGLNPRYPRRFHEMNRRREHRLANMKSNHQRQFGENDLLYDPNKVRPRPEDRDIFYE